MTGFTEWGIKNPGKEPEMGKKYRTYSNDFKKQLIVEIESGAISLSEAARRHEISRLLVEKWRDKIRNGTLVDRPTTREKQLERELEKAQAKIGQLTLAIDFLKKIRKSSASMRGSNGCIVTGGNMASRSEPGAK